MLSLSLPASRFAPCGYDLKYHSPKVSTIDDEWREIFDALYANPFVDTSTGMLRFGGCGRKVEKFIKRKVKSGISPKIRGLYWKYIAQTDTFKYYLPNGLYAHLISFPQSIGDKEILLDINRTRYTKSQQFQNSQPLFNVLRAYNLYNPDVGYCQGMSYIVGMLLTQMNEEDSFYTLISLLEKYNLQEMYRPGLPALGEMCDFLSRSIEKYLPKLYSHFLNEKINTTMYAVQWFMTLFTYNTTLDRAAPIWDLFYIRGIESLQKVSLALLKHLEPKLLKLSLEPMISTLVCLDDVDMTKIVQMAMKK